MSGTVAEVPPRVPPWTAPRDGAAGREPRPEYPARVRASAENPPAAPAGSGTTEPVPAERRPVRTLTVLSVVVAVQSLVVFVYGVYLLVQGVVGHPVSVAQAESVGGIVVFFGLGLLVVPVGLIRARAWSRTPTVMLEVLSFALVYDLWLAHVYWLAAIAAVIAAGALWLVFQPTVTRALYDASSRRPAVPVAAKGTSGRAAGTVASATGSGKGGAPAKPTSGKRR